MSLPLTVNKIFPIGPTICLSNAICSVPTKFIFNFLITVNEIYFFVTVTLAPATLQIQSVANQQNVIIVN